jgi:nitrite reductase/ring-hydroxylating ferredoxin subunit
LEDDQLVLTLSEVSSLEEVGGAVKLRSLQEDGKELAIIVLHAAADDYRAFEDRCTHNGKELDYSPSQAELMCLSRGSRFDLEGEVIQGRADSPLSRYALRREGDELILDL